ncbi:IS3 family transposase [[Clostridium] leptum]|uniref:IS3 family transposase n=1 Tax=[Clostridium] leptum TaxID=1535 RepID=A0A412AUZ9_9FIRM|nr:IS3 family transposase [[Clostridium] leptum]
MPNKYPEEIKKQVVQFYKDGRPVSEISKELQIPFGTVYRWIDEYRSCISNDLDFTPAKFKALSRQLERANHLLRIIQLSKLIDEAPLRKRLEILAGIYENETYSVHELCDALNVARGTFYNHIFRRANRTEYLKKQTELMLLVQQIFDENDQRFGAEKIRIILAEHGFRVGTKNVSKIMQELDLHSIRSDAKRSYLKRQENRRRNLVQQNFTTERPNQIWVSDITYFKVNNYPLYLCVIIDLFSRKVIGYKVSKNQSTHLVTSTFKHTFEERGTPNGLIFHSDRGGQYISGAFTKLLRNSGVQQSFSASGRPCDNAVAETFFATFKKEEAYRRTYSSEQDYRKSVEQYIEFYNEKRPHRSLAYKTPAHFEELFGKK